MFTMLFLNIIPFIKLDCDITDLAKSSRLFDTFSYIFIILHCVLADENTWATINPSLRMRASKIRQLPQCLFITRPFLMIMQAISH